MEISSLELNGAFCIPGHPDHFPLQSPDMCKYTIFNLECGHPAEDHVESRDCPHYQRNGFPCDRENPANRDRVTVRSEGRKGLCRICQRKEQEKAELDAMQRETKKAREVSLAEAQEREQAAKEHEERIIRESTKEYERLLREREKADMEAALRASQDAHEKRRQQEARDLENALKASRELPPPERNVTIEESFSRGENEYGMYEVKRTEKTTITHTTTYEPPVAASAPPPPPPPPPPPVKAAPRSRPPPKEKSQPREVRYDLGPMGPQDIGHLTIGNRRQPIHESQKLQEPTGPKSLTRSSAPVSSVRLGGIVNAADIPIVRQGPSMQVPVAGARANLRRSAGARPPMPAFVESAAQSELQAKLAKRRTWEADEDATSNFSVTPSDCASNVETPGESDKDTPSDLSTRTARLSLGADLDERRRKGWSK